MKSIHHTNQTYYKYKITRTEDNDIKLCFKYEDVKEYCGIPRSTLYKVFNGATPKLWCKKYTFEKVRLPRHQLREIEYDIQPSFEFNSNNYELLTKQ